ncbi:UDP-glycosyltransferase 91C1-like [Macadamia integrifolia]|uniref:UDP-glycosyltransferase 91C1-like n=1 Tax=Macadamia integrifolia TaxID=60698 RepID=UPI001C4E4AFE|nr:UDP-glycosyltransferase 91C1-like [Macadamia integrifolia]
MAADQNEELHIVMLPWLAFGHMIPFLELSKSLAQRGHRISFVSTPRNIATLPKLPPNLVPLISFVKLSLPDVDGLPENAEATSDVSYEKIPYLKKAFDGLELPLARILEISPPDWIIYDFAPYWLPPIASRLGVPCAFFYTFTAAAIAFFGPPRLQAPSSVEIEYSRTKPEHFTVPPKWVPFPSDVVFRLHEILRMFDRVDANASGVSDGYRFSSTMNGCSIVAVRSCIEFEAEWLHLLQGGLFKKPVIPVGLFPRSVKATGDVADDADERWIGIREWLDKQKEGSVVYIALGSEVIPSQDEMNELALGLELSGLPFFWVLRMPTGLTGFDSVLPSGFEQRTGGRGFIYRGWAPQLRVLAHPSVGSFVTHCGFSSIIEAFALGCPLILLPLLNDQPLNARLLQGKKIGLEIPRDERDGSLSRDSVAESLRIVMVEKAELFKAQAREMRKIFGDKARHDRYVDDFDNYLRHHGRRCPKMTSQAGFETPESVTMGSH